jgi:hypothetical protein
MFVIIPLVIQIQGNQIRIGVAKPPSVINQPHPHQGHPPSPAPRGDGPSFQTLHRMLMNPSVN